MHAMAESVYQHPEPFLLESGGILPSLRLAYRTFGTLNEAGDNVIWACHALTANNDVFDWWEGLFGEQALFNPEAHFIVCVNNPGSCYGSSGPLDINPYTGLPWFDYFPALSIKDIARSFELLRRQLGIQKIHSLIGGSQGGQIALEWALLNPDLAEHLILIATNARHSPWGIAFNESQRLAIKADRTYYSQTEEGGKKGLAAARSIALLSYRSYDTYGQTQEDPDTAKTSDYRAAAYQRYQGEKLVNRFNAYSYVRLLDAMDSHHIARGRTGSLEESLSLIRSRTLVISVSSDILFPVQEQAFLARHITGARHITINSAYGHDGFLIETAELSRVINGFYEDDRSEQPARSHHTHYTFEKQL